MLVNSLIKLLTMAKSVIRGWVPGVELGNEIVQLEGLELNVEKSLLILDFLDLSV